MAQTVRDYGRLAGGQIFRRVIDFAEVGMKLELGEARSRFIPHPQLVDIEQNEPKWLSAFV